MKLPAEWTVLLVDDSEDDRYLIRFACERAGVDGLQVVASATDGIAYVMGEGKYADRKRFPFPSVIITDLKMPGENGFSLLKTIKANPDLSIVPVIVLSSSNDPHDILTAYRLGAQSYVPKPFDLQALTAFVSTWHAYWSFCEVPETNAHGKLVESPTRGKLSE